MSLSLYTTARMGSNPVERFNRRPNLGFGKQDAVIWIHGTADRGTRQARWRNKARFKEVRCAYETDMILLIERLAL